jgi:hypothetical protein
MSDHLDPAILENLKAGEDAWTIGSGAIKVLTESGSTYLVDNDGNVTGGTHLPDGGVLSGAVYRMGGPIRTKSVLVGLCMEVTRPNQPYPKNYIVTSPVVSILDG